MNEPDEATRTREYSNHYEAIRSRILRANETPEQRKARVDELALRYRSERANETPAEREERLMIRRLKT